MMSGPQRLEGRYLVDEPIERGGRAHVYRGRRILNGQTVALKRLASDPAAPHYQQDLELLQEEHRVLTSLGLPCVPRPVELFEAEGTWWLVEEFMEGTPLADALEDSGPLPVERSGGIMLSVLHLLEGLHRRNLTVRELKPENVVVAPDGSAWLVNFAVARKDARREDIAMAGALLQCMLAGTGPESSSDARRQLLEVVRRSLDADPARRFPSVAAMRHALVGKGRLRGVARSDMPGGSLGPCLRVLHFPNLASYFPWLLSWLANRDRWVAVHEHGLRFEEGDELHELPWGEIGSLSVRRDFGRISRIEVGVVDDRIAWPGPWPGLEDLAEEIVRNARLVRDAQASRGGLLSSETLYRR